MSNRILGPLCCGNAFLLDFENCVGYCYFSDIVMTFTIFLNDKYDADNYKRIHAK